VKRTIAIMVGVVSVGASAYLASHLYAQTAQPYNPAAAPAAAAAHCTCKIACINLQKVIKDYLKFKNLQADMKKEADGYRMQIDTFNAKIKQIQAQGEQPTATPEQRETLARQIKDLQRQAQDKSEEFNGLLQKHQFDHMVATYKDIQDACAAFCRSSGIELLMHYQEGEGSEMYMPQFFSRRMSNGACQPIYMAPGMDVTAQVTEMLNARIRGSAAAPAAPGAAPRAQ
jgi:Skp family chaperone for outer membrane proteins